MASSSPASKPYTFNRKVVMIMGAIIGIAAIITTFATVVSESPPHFILKMEKIAGNLSSLLSPAKKPSDISKKQQQLQQKSERKFVLVQHEFGWNGTTGGPNIIVNKGDLVHISIVNSGLMAHNFGIAMLSEQTTNLIKMTNNMSLESRLDHIPYNVLSSMPCPGCQPLFEEGHITTFIRPSSHQDVTFTASQEGNFKYFCMVRGHLWLGMIGNFIVKNNVPIKAAAINTTL